MIQINVYQMAFALLQISKMILISSCVGYVNQKMRRRTLDEAEIFFEFTEEREGQITQKGLQLQYINSHFQLQRVSYSFRRSLDMLDDLMGMNKCLALYSNRGIWLFNVQNYHISVRDEKAGLIVIDSNQPQNSIYNGHKYFLYVLRHGPDINFRLALSRELSRYVQRDIDCQVLDFIKGQIDELPVDQEFRFQCQGLGMNQFQQNVIKEAGLNRIMLIEGAAGVGKSLVGTLIATKYAEQGKKVLLTAVTFPASKAISEHMTHSLSIHHNHHLHYQFLRYIRAIIKVRTQIHNPAKQNEIINTLDRQIKTIVKRLMTEKINFLYLNSLVTIREYFTVQPFLRFYTYNTQLIISMLRVTEFNVNVLDIIIFLNKIANMKFVDATWKQRYQQAVRLVIREADIITTHTSMISDINTVQKQDEQFKPYVTIFDEAGQATLENAYCIFKLGTTNLILIGDDKQAKPLTKQFKEVKKTLFTMLRHNQEVSTFRLTDQFRMNEQINDLVRYVSYQHREVNYQYRGEEHISHQEFLCEKPLFMINHNFREQQNEDKFYNDGEIKMIRLYLNQFSNDKLQEVGIVTFFRAQVKRLKQEFHQEMKCGLSISTVEGYQGQSKDHILFSVVRNNKKGDLGAVKYRNGVNVGLSRARKGLIIFGNVETLLKQPNDNPWKDVIEYLGNRKRVFWFNDELTHLAEAASENPLQRDTSQYYDIGKQFIEEDEDEDRYLTMQEAAALDDGKEVQNTGYETVELPFIEKNRY